MSLDNFVETKPKKSKKKRREQAAEDSKLKLRKPKEQGEIIPHLAIQLVQYDKRAKRIIWRTRKIFQENLTYWNKYIFEDAQPPEVDPSEKKQIWFHYIPEDPKEPVKAKNNPKE